MKIESFYRHFLLTPVSHLPVLDADKNIVGLLSKDKIAREMADLESEGFEYAKIPEHLLDNQINEKLLQYFFNYRTIPVINDLGQRIDAWEKPRFLAETSKLLEKKEPKKEEPPPEEEVSEAKSRMLIYRFMELILRSFPDALYATDKDGDTTFYNEKFETLVLSKNIFRDSITIAEKYFRELSRDLISEFFKTVEPGSEESLDLPCLQIYVGNLQLFIRLITLRADEKVIGYLYHFLDPNISWMNQKGHSNFPLLEELFQMSTPLSDVLKQVESTYITRSFKKNQENISHTANDLKIPRSTLQNRIKFLGLTEILGRDMDVPVPRTKREGLKNKAVEASERIKEQPSTEIKSDTESPSTAKKLRPLQKHTLSVPEVDMDELFAEVLKDEEVKTPEEIPLPVENPVKNKQRKVSKKKVPAKKEPKQNPKTKKKTAKKKKTKK